MIQGMFRGNNGNEIVSHLYEGDFANPGNPYCSNGWNRKYFNEKGELIDWQYSIFRGHMSPKGTCEICRRRYLQGRKAISKPTAKYNRNNPNHSII